jgi:hypothetical protein
VEVGPSPTGISTGTTFVEGGLHVVEDARSCALLSIWETKRIRGRCR